MNTANKNIIKTEVIIIGAGLAALRAAGELIEHNINVVMVTSGSLCSGSSFYPKTWGLGMIVPQGEDGKESLLKSIEGVSCGASNLELDKILVDNLKKEITWLKNQGINLKAPLSEKGVIPCFDNDFREWYGFDFNSAKKTFNKYRDNDNLVILEKTKVLNIYNEGQGAKGVLSINEQGQLTIINGKAIIIASGGYTCLYEHSFSLEESSPIIQALALDLGCDMINLEFIQFIPAYTFPSYKTLFNERAFRYITLMKEEGSELLTDLKDSEELLLERSTYGPFTTRLKSGVIDIEIFKYYKNNCKGPYFYYPKGIEDIEDTLIYNYFQWLKERKVDINSKVNIASFAHACNGGIAINERGETNVEGIYACGEASGGIHGADRLGGLATGSALVFGHIAADSAKNYCKEVELKSINPEVISIEEGEEDLLKLYIKEVRKIMYEEGSIIRSEESLIRGKKRLNSIKDYLLDVSKSKKVNTVLKLQLTSYINFGNKVLESMLNRKYSLGSHYREDDRW